MIGGTGHFGGRICRRIVGEKNTELIVTSRSHRKANAFAEELRKLKPDATISSACLDQASPDLADDLVSLHPALVLHTAGPYQGQDYRVAEACIASGSHYIDLADGRDFVQGFHSLHEKAVEKGVLLVSGASTLPGLSSVVIDHLRGQFHEIHDIEISIAPAHQTPRGASTVAAVLSYCGKPFKVLWKGDWVTRYGWQDMKLIRHPQLGSRLSGACDVPDLGLLPDYVAGSKTVTFHAALEAKWEQVALWLMAWLTRLHIVTNWNRFVSSFRWLSDRLIKLGSDVGGMYVRLSGIDVDHSAKTITWFLTARQNHGPEIPCVPALILARKLLAEQLPQRGAFPCLGLFTLHEFDHEVGGLDIDWNIEESAS